MRRAGLFCRQAASFFRVSGASPATSYLSKPKRTVKAAAQVKPAWQSASVAHSAQRPETQTLPKPCWALQSSEDLHSPFLGGEGQAVSMATEVVSARMRARRMGGPPGGFT